MKMVLQMTVQMQRNKYSNENPKFSNLPCSIKISTKGKFIVPISQENTKPNILNFSKGALKVLHFSNCFSF